MNFFPENKRCAGRHHLRTAPYVFGSGQTTRYFPPAEIPKGQVHMDGFIDPPHRLNRNKDIQSYELHPPPPHPSGRVLARKVIPLLTLSDRGVGTGPARTSNADQTGGHSTLVLLVSVAFSHLRLARL